MPASISIIYSIKDAKNETSSTEVAIPSTTSLLNASLFASEMAKLIAPLLKGVITRIGLVFSVTVPGTIPTTADPSSDVEEGARAQFRSAGGFFKGMRLATFDEDKIETGGTAVDLADLDVIAYVNAMTGGINVTPVGGTGSVTPTDARDDDLTALSFFKEDFQSSRG